MRREGRCYWQILSRHATLPSGFATADVGQGAGGLSVERAIFAGIPAFSWCRPRAECELDSPSPTQAAATRKRPFEKNRGMSDAEPAGTHMLTLTNHTKLHPEATCRALQAAEGYVFFGLHREALRELDSIPDYEQDDCDVMIARTRVLLHLGRWKKAAQLSAHGASLHHSEDEFTVQRAFALHQMNLGDDAARVLLDAPEWLRRTGILHYNLGCYEARWGNLTVARQCVAAAIEINSAIKKNARQDPDLAELWN